MAKTCAAYWSQSLRAGQFSQLQASLKQEEKDKSVAIPSSRSIQSTINKNYFPTGHLSRNPFEQVNSLNEMVQEKNVCGVLRRNPFEQVNSLNTEVKAKDIPMPVKSQSLRAGQFSKHLNL